MTRLIDSISFLYREVFEMKAITSGFKTVTLTVFTVKFYIPTRWLRINLSVLCYSCLKIYLYDSTKLHCSKKYYYKFSWKGIYILDSLDWFQNLPYLKIPAVMSIKWQLLFEMEISNKAKTTQGMTTLFLLLPMRTPLSAWQTNATLKCNRCFWLP